AYVESAHPAGFNLLRAYPNPFNNSVALQFSLAHPAWTNLKVYSVSGREVAEIYLGQLEGGEHRFVWEAGEAPSGLYFLRLEIAGSQQIEKLVYLR
ncbi:MAG TPA: T9SS type A sorting domain-containing protein, partial [bacterium]